MLFKCNPFLLLGKCFATLGLNIVEPVVWLVSVVRWLVWCCGVVRRQPWRWLVPPNLPWQEAIHAY